MEPACVVVGSWTQCVARRPPLVRPFLGQARDAGGRLRSDHQSHRVCGGIDRIQPNRGTRGRVAWGIVQKGVASVGSGVPRGQVLRAIPPGWRDTSLTAPRLLYRRSRGGPQHSVTHTRRGTVSDLLSEARGRDSMILAWRLLITEPTDGALNMAIDEALWRGRHAGTSPPTLRFFAWDPPTVSVGYGQPLDRHVDVEACRRLGVGLVRRPTGGSAIYHDGPERELTYCITATAA